MFYERQKRPGSRVEPKPVFLVKGVFSAPMLIRGDFDRVLSGNVRHFGTVILFGTVRLFGTAQRYYPSVYGNVL